MYTGLICGVDEAGRGPLAGSVFAAAVILDPNYPIDGIADSKKLSAKKREALAILIKEKALAWAIAESTCEEIDQINILQASLLAMRRAIEQISPMPTMIRVDGNKVPAGFDHCDIAAIIGGDQSVAAISAASILAKTARDDTLLILDQTYPVYGFKQHKGYPTKLHVQKLQEHGPCPAHRKTFGSVARCLKAEQ